MTIILHKGDLPDGLDLGASVAIDTETLGLHPHRDRLCLVQLSAGDGDAHLVQIPADNIDAPNLRRLIDDQAILKIFHFGRFDIAMLNTYLGTDCRPVFCTKIASRLTRTYTDRHGLKDLCREMLGVDLSKAQQSSDWGAETLSKEQQTYAASDVLHLHDLKKIFVARLARENRTELAQSCFDFLPTRAAIDLAGWPDEDIFSH
ncbi:MAG: ribonuclease D [Rhizobiales bacterium]|nr:ribonuclease D [Hyphomicrobiales bacterium]